MEPNSIEEIEPPPSNVARFDSEDLTLRIPSLASGDTLFTNLVFQLVDSSAFRFKLESFNTRPDVIFHNGKILTIENRYPQVQSLALVENTIVAVGSDEDILPMADSNTQLIDLQGRTLMPGFVDAHTHSLGQFDPLEAFQDHVLAGGVTSIGIPSMRPGRMETLLSQTQSTRLRIRVSTHLTYNSKCDGIWQPEGWYLADYPPLKDPNEMIRVLGIKIFGDPAGPSLSCGWAAMGFLLPEAYTRNGISVFGDLLLNTEELTEEL